MASSYAGKGEVSLGSVNGVFGLKGEVRLFLHNRESDLLESEQAVVLVDPNGKRRSARLRSRSGAGGRVLGIIQGVHDREQARALMGHEILVDAALLPPIAEDEYYHHQLLGLSVVDVGGEELGKLAAVHEGQVDLWEVRGAGEPRYLPALREVVLRVDLTARQITVDLEALVVPNEE